MALRPRMPSAPVLALLGVAVALLAGSPHVAPSPDLMTLAVLPPLLAVAAIDVPPSALRTAWPVLLALAVGLVLATAVGIAIAAHTAIPSMSWRVGFVLGAVLASTDPVAVAAIARQARLPRRLVVIVQGESLLNDATSLILVGVAEAVAVGHHSAASVLLLILRLAAGGVAIGAAVAMAVSATAPLGGSLRVWSRHRGVRLMTSLVPAAAPFAASALAYLVGASVVTAAIACGLVLAHRLEAGDVTHRIVGGIASVLEPAVFALVGFTLPGLVRRLSHEERGLLWLAIVLVGVILAVRVLWAVPLSGRSGWRTATALTWAGTRGVLPLVAVLTVPVVTDGVPFPHRDLLVALTAGVTLLTLVVQGLTLALLLRRLSFVPPRR